MAALSRIVPAIVACAALAFAAHDAKAQWKWKDKAGRVQYSDLPPPPETPEGDILSRPGGRARSAQLISTSPLPAASMVAAAPASGASAAAPKLVDPALEAARKKAEADAAAKNKAEEARVAAARADNCQRAKSQLATIDSGVRMVRANEKGEKEYLDDRQRADEARRMRDLISTDCR